MILYTKDIIIWKKKIFIDPQKFNITACWLKLPLKIKRSKFFAVRNDMQKISFRKLFTERGFCELKTYDIKDMLLCT